jgi:hypothetical protein
MASKAFFALFLAAVAATLGVACSQVEGATGTTDGGAVESDASTPVPVSTDSGSAPTDAGIPHPDAHVADAGTSHHDAGVVGDAAQPTCIDPPMPQSCTAPVMTALPLCKLSETGCMDPKNPTAFGPRAVYYEVNSPLWSDNAAKTRAFVIPDGGTIHVKDCRPDASATELAECVSPTGVQNGPADTGKWVFPVGTVLIKNFLFDGKIVETRLLMRVDAATAALIQNGSDWVGYNYAWNEQQTEATIVPDARTPVSFNTGKRTVSWDYPNYLDCIGCHAPAVGAIGPETAQMNRLVDGGNQIDTFKAMGLFDTTAPTAPYAAPLVEPYANAALGLKGPPAGTTVDQAARSYLSANCGFCHRPDVNDQGFDLRHSLTLNETGICNLTQQNGIPGMTNQTLLDIAPGSHAASATWIRMNIPIPASDPNGVTDVGRMPSVGSAVVDPQATALIGSWIDSMQSCPGDGGM